MSVQEQLVTVEAFETFIARPDNRDRRFELIDGEIVEKMPTEEHGVITGNIFGFLWNFSRDRGLGRVAVEVRHRMPGDPYNDRLPDVAYYADASRPIVKQGPVPHMPDLVVEVKSPHDTYKEMRDKAAYYLANGARLVWLVYPEKRLVVLLSKEAEDLLAENDTLTGGEVLPGFAVTVSEMLKV